MPIHLQGEINNSATTPRKGEEVFRKDFGYKYPEGLNLRPNSDFHKEILTKIIDRIQASRNVMSRYKAGWQEIDKVLRLYISADAADGRESKAPNSQAKKEAGYADLIIPESYATLETVLTYYMTSFMQDPIFQYEGVGPEDVVGARLMTHLINHQAKTARMGLNLHTQFRDDTAYGFGVIAPMWRRVYGKKPKVRQFGYTDQENIFHITREEKDFEEDALLYEGNELQNINPYLYYPDPSVPIHEPEKASYIAWVEESTITNLLSLEDDPETLFFNVRYLKELDGRSQFSTGPKQSTRTENSTGSFISGNADIIWMYIDLIPKEWKLGPEDYPRKWLFGVGGDKVIVYAEQVDYTHGRTPVVVCATGFDGYSVTPVSKLTMVHDVQTLINFMYTSHIHNVRKALNDMFIIDPSIVNYYDVINPAPGKVIRTRRAAWGNQMLDHAIKQLNVTDVTQQHVAEAHQLGELMRRISATSDPMQGGFAQRTSRISAREAGGVIGASLSRFQKNAQIIDMQSMGPLAMFLASHTQQFMEMETFVKVSGDWPSKYLADLTDVDGRIAISPFDLMINFDIMPTHGNVPGSEDPQTWTQLFQIASQNPIIAQQLDWIKLFKHIGRNLGAKNVDEFITRVRPDEEIEQQRALGNIVPAEEV